MENKRDRLQRENKHFKKQVKKASSHKKHKVKRMIEESEEKNWKRVVE